MKRTQLRPSNYQENITLIETIFGKSSCPLIDEHCQNRSRIILQTEQYLKDYLSLCHHSPNCIIFEFSDYNYRIASTEKNLTDSLVLLPIMHQSPSRLTSIVAASDNESQISLADRPFDIVFFGLITKRRRFLLAESEKYMAAHPNSSVLVMKTRPREISYMINAYKKAKVCIIAHSYSNVSGGEYHRLTEFAEFGCIPVMEDFSDKIGINQYRQCAHSFFAKQDNLFKTAEDVITLINAGKIGSDFSHVQWWKEGIAWEKILSNLD